MTNRRRRRWWPPGGLRLVRVRGRSMLPTLREGDVLLVRVGAPPLVGGLALVRLPEGRPTAVKRVVRRDGEGWWVERDNPREGVDSWQVGAVSDADVVGRVLTRVWPARWPASSPAVWDDPGP